MTYIKEEAKLTKEGVLEFLNFDGNALTVELMKEDEEYRKANNKIIDNPTHSNRVFKSTRKLRYGIVFKRHAPVIKALRQCFHIEGPLHHMLHTLINDTVTIYNVLGEDKAYNFINLVYKDIQNAPNSWYKGCIRKAVGRVIIYLKRTDSDHKNVAKRKPHVQLPLAEKEQSWFYNPPTQRIPYPIKSLGQSMIGPSTNDTQYKEGTLEAMPFLLNLNPIEFYNKKVSSYYKLPKWIKESIPVSRLGKPENYYNTHCQGNLTMKRWMISLLKLSTYESPMHHGESISNRDELRFNIIPNKMISNLNINSIKRWKNACNIDFQIINIMKSDAAENVVNYIVSGITDTQLYRDYADEFKTITSKMSITKMIGVSVYNHRAMLAITAKKNKKLLNDTSLMKVPDVPLCDELEALRLKTKGQVRMAGAECRHCISGYAESGESLIFRKDNICALVQRGKVTQCFDKGNTVTKASKEFKKFILNRLK